MQSTDHFQESKKTQLASAFICQISNLGHTWLQKMLKDKVTSFIFRAEIEKGEAALS